MALEDLPAAKFNEAADDVRQQLQELMTDDFLAATPWLWLEHFPRYLKAICQRLEKLRHGGQARDGQAMQEMAPQLELLYQRTESHRQRGIVDPQLETFRWMLEEFRVSLFAQQLGTSQSVSTRRLEKQWAKVTP